MSSKPVRRWAASLARTDLDPRQPRPARADRSRGDRAGKTRSEFMLHAARRAAEETLLDRTLFHVGAGEHARLVALLDRPARDKPRLRKLMRAKAPWR